MGGKRKSLGGRAQGKQRVADAARREQIGGPGRRAKVVLRRGRLTVRRAHHIDAGDVRDGRRGASPSEVPLEERAGGRAATAGRSPAAQDAPLAVDVGEEGVQRGHALREPVGEQPPLGGVEDARHGVDAGTMSPAGFAPELDALPGGRSSARPATEPGRGRTGGARRSGRHIGRAAVRSEGLIERAAAPVHGLRRTDTLRPEEPHARILPGAVFIPPRGPIAAAPVHEVDPRTPLDRL